MKRKLLILLTCLLFICSCAFLLSACKKSNNNSGHDSQGLYYTLNQKGTGYIASYYNNSHVEEVFIPNEHEGIPVVEIGRNGFAHSDVKLVQIPITITNIGEGAFYGCKSLKQINIPSGVTSISKDMFRDCTSLRNMKLEENITSIGDGAFENCTKLEIIELPNNLKTIGHSAFSDCTSIREITIGSGTTSIADYAFFNCTSLKNINVSSNNLNYKSIDGNLYTKDGSTLLQYAIAKTITTFSIPNTVTSLTYYPFYGCTSLTSIVIPTSVTSIGVYAFWEWTSLKTIYCKAENKPSGWADNWNGDCSAKVVWGYTEN